MTVGTSLTTFQISTIRNLLFTVNIYLHARAHICGVQMFTDVSINCVTPPPPAPPVTKCRNSRRQVEPEGVLLSDVLLQGGVGGAEINQFSGLHETLPIVTVKAYFLQLQ